ncbi:MAG TPA: DUF86 domain-containing protein [Planctomycetota bacterium]|nr:DUF86 domain-containing protein [Planctomycetota bacterium]
MNDVAAGKVRNIRDCVQRLRAVDPGTLEGIEQDQLVQESLVLNVQRACQAAIDLATHLVQAAGLGPPNDSRDAFARLEAAGRLSRPLSERLQAMVGFRNVAVQRDHVLDLRVLRSILDGRLADLLAFAALVERDEA